MSTADEIQELKTEIVQYCQAILKKESVLPRLKKEVKRLRYVIEAEKSALKVATSNLRHMKGSADHVVLSEFVEVRKIAEAKKAALDAAQQELAVTESDILATERYIKAANEALRRSETALRGYGQLRQFKK